MAIRYVRHDTASNPGGDSLRQYALFHYEHVINYNRNNMLVPMTVSYIAFQSKVQHIRKLIICPGSLMLSKLDLSLLLQLGTFPSLIEMECFPTSSLSLIFAFSLLHT
jgi:hypothetical protein